MASIYQALAQRIGFAAKGNILWGTVEGYRFGIVLQQQPYQMHIFTSVHFPDDSYKGAVVATLEASKAEKTIHSYSVTDYGFEMIYKQNLLTGYSVKKIKRGLSMLAESLRQQAAVPACTHCGSSAQMLSFMQYNDMPLSMCKDCQAQIQESLHSQEDAYAQLPSNYGRGAIGALLGALLGGVIWIAVGQLGYIAAIAGMAISAFAAKGYGMMKGKLDRVAVAIICTICLVVFALAQFIGMDVTLIRDIIAQGYEPDYGTILLATFEIPFYDSDLTRVFLGDSVLGLIFLAAGSWGTLRAMGRQAANPAGRLVRLDG